MASRWIVGAAAASWMLVDGCGDDGPTTCLPGFHRSPWQPRVRFDDRVDADGQILEPMDELPGFATWPGPHSSPLRHVFQTEFHGLEPRPWGSLAHGLATSDEGPSYELFVALDHHGEPISTLETYPGRYAVTGDGRRNWTLANQSSTALRLVEFGCALEE